MKTEKQIQSSTSQEMNHHKSPIFGTRENFFPFPIIALAFIFFFLLGSLFESIIMIIIFCLLIPIFISIQSIYSFNVENDTYIEGYEVFGQIQGEWINAGRIDAVIISNPTYKHKINTTGISAVGGGTVNCKVSNWKLELLNKRGKKFYIAEYDEKENCLKLAVQLAFSFA